VHVAVGSSLGDRRAHLATALAGLRATPGIVPLRASPLYETAPVGGMAERRFLNGVLELEVAPAFHDDPLALLSRLQRIEAQAGRSRCRRWEDRTLDLDVVLWGEWVIAEPTLQVPHPELRRRRFVLQPLADLVPHAPVPPDGVPVARLLADLARDAVDEIARAADGVIPASPSSYPEGWPLANPG
jgi:2-amino-4-hydroxy-6-hydroxymethyldihydropteridine diphosphokinase